MSTTQEIARLLRSLDDAVAELRCTALIALAEIRQGVTGAPILPLLADPDEAVRAAAAFALSKVGDAGAVPHLLAAWRATDPSQHHLRRQLLIALGDIGGLSAIEPIVDALAHLSPELQELALGFIGSEPAPARREQLLRLLDQEVSPEARAEILRMLAKQP